MQIHHVTDALENSPLESDRFRLRVFRWRGHRLDARELAPAIYAARADMVILRLPSEHASDANRMTAFGLHPQYADTLVYQEVALHQGETSTCRNQDLSFSRAQNEDAMSLANLVRACFTGYRSHYANNPALDQTAVLEGYVEWAMQHVSDEHALLQTWLVKRDNAIVGFAACRENADANEAEIVLNGVHPDHAGRGVYSELVHFVRRQYAARGRKRLLISTQITNRAVQKVWARQGFHLHASWTTFHLTPCLSAGLLAIDTAVTFGDELPIQLIQAQVRNLIPEATFLRIEQVLLGPLTRQPCRMQLRFANGIPDHGHAQAVALVETGEGSLCAAVFLDLAL